MLNKCCSYILHMYCVELTIINNVLGARRGEVYNKFIIETFKFFQMEYFVIFHIRTFSVAIKSPNFFFILGNQMYLQYPS